MTKEENTNLGFAVDNTVKKDKGESDQVAVDFDEAWEEIEQGEHYFLVNNKFKATDNEPDQVTVGVDVHGYHYCSCDYDSPRDFIVNQLVACNDIERFCKSLDCYTYEDAAFGEDLINDLIQSENPEKCENWQKEWLDLMVEKFNAKWQGTKLGLYLLKSENGE